MKTACELRKCKSTGQRCSDKKKVHQGSSSCIPPAHKRLCSTCAFCAFVEVLTPFRINKIGSFWYSGLSSLSWFWDFTLSVSIVETSCAATSLFSILLGFWTQATMLYFKRNITCASKCVCYYEGTLKQCNAPSARMLPTNQHIERSQPQILHNESESSSCPSAMHNNMAAQNKMGEGSHHVHA